MLGHQDHKNLETNLKDLGIHLRSQEIDFQISDFLKADKKELCNRIFKWKAKKNNPFVCLYYEALFNRWKDCEKIKPRKKNGKKKNRKNKRPKSIDAMSNETNQT